MAASNSLVCWVSSLFYYYTNSFEYWSFGNRNVSKTGTIGSYQSYSKTGSYKLADSIRPIVTLKDFVNIASGDWFETNPYKLTV